MKQPVDAVSSKEYYRTRRSKEAAIITTY